MFTLIGRMRVEPGSAPVWEGGDQKQGKRGLFSRRYQRGLRNSMLGGNSFNIPDEIEEENNRNVLTQIERSILEKFKNEKMFTQAQKASIYMTMVAQTETHAKLIFREACHRVSMSMDKEQEMEGMSETQIARIYYEEVLEEALGIVENEFEFPKGLNIEAFAKREKEVKEKLDKGEITEEEAKDILREPIYVREKNYETNSYEEAYEKETKENRKNNNRRKRYKKNRSRMNRENNNRSQKSDEKQNTENSTKTGNNKDEKPKRNRSAEFRRKQAEYEKVDPMQKQSNSEQEEQINKQVRGTGREEKENDTRSDEDIEL